MRTIHMLALCAVVCGVTTASGTTIRGFTTRDMVREAAVVVRGTVADRTSVWSPDHTRIYTDSTVRLKEVLVGKVAGRQIQVRQIGGRVGGTEMAVPGVAPIHPGEDVLLFLRTDGQRYYLVGMAQGKYGVRLEKGQWVADRKLEGLNLLGTTRHDHPRVHNPTARSYDALRNEIRTHARELGRQR